jgi:hypothetical protein
VRILPTSSRLRRILAAYTVNKLGTWFGLVALSLAVYDHTHNAAAVTALFIARYLPALAVPALVARVEASNRRGALSTLYLFEALCATLLAALLWHFVLPTILVLVALDGAAELTASSLLRAQAARAGAEDAQAGAEDAQALHEPSDARERRLARSDGERQADERGGEDAERGMYNANASLNVALAISVVAGPMLAALAVAAFGGPIALLIDAGSFLACGALLIDLRAHMPEGAGASVRARLTTAWRYVRTAPALRSLLVIQATALVFFETGAPVEVFYAKGTLRAGDVGFGVLLAAWGAGQLVGSVIFARRTQRSLGAMLTLGTLAVGLAYLGFAAAPTLTFAAVAALLGGVGNGVQWASLLGVVQLLTPERLHGRLMGGVESIGALCPLVGLPLSGLVMGLSSPRVALLAFGSVIVLTTLGFARLWALGQLQASHAGPDALESESRSPAGTINASTSPGGLTVASAPAPDDRRLTTHSDHA